MSSQELVELRKIKKLLKKQIAPALKKVKKAKLQDLLKPANVNERINAFLDKLTVEDLIKTTTWLAAVGLIYPIVYKLKDPAWWAAIPIGYLFGIIPGIIFGFLAEKKEEIEEMEFSMPCLAVSIIVAYAVMYRGESVVGYAKSLINALPAVI